MKVVGRTASFTAIHVTEDCVKNAKMNIRGIQ